MIASAGHMRELPVSVHIGCLVTCDLKQLHQMHTQHPFMGDEEDDKHLIIEKSLSAWQMHTSLFPKTFLNVILLFFVNIFILLLFL